MRIDCLTLGQIREKPTIVEAGGSLLSGYQSINIHLMAPVGYAT